jgi:hypothetical protein
MGAVPNSLLLIPELPEPSPREEVVVLKKPQTIKQAEQVPQPLDEDNAPDVSNNNENPAEKQDQ